MAAATARPSASAGPIEPIDTAITAPIMAMSFASMELPLPFFHIARGGADEDGGQNCKNVSLHKADQYFENHERDGHEKPRESHHQRDDEFTAHDIAEEAQHEREGPRYLGQDVERQHDEFRFG